VYRTGPVTNKNPVSRQWLQFTSFRSQEAVWPEGEWLPRDSPVGWRSCCLHPFKLLFAYTYVNHLQNFSSGWNDLS